MKIRIGLVLVLIAGCSSERELTSDPSGSSLTAPTSPCSRAFAPADRTRKVVVTHPYGNGDRALKKLDVLELSPDGVLTITGMSFEMPKAAFAPIAFTPDGEIGLVTQDDGSVGVFRFGVSGAPEVMPSIANSGFYASSIVIDPSGTRAYALDPDTAAHGGGVYELAIGCDGTVTPRGVVVPGGAANAMAFFPSDRQRAIVAGHVLGAGDEADSFLLDMHGPTPLAKGSAFGDGAAIPSSAAIMPDGNFALISDDSINAGNRVAIVSVPKMKQKQLLSVDVPYAIVASVFDNAAIVVNGDSADQVTTLRYDSANVETPFAVTGPVPWTLPRPQLPGAAVQITRGKLKGRVLIAELLAVRQIQFATDGAVQDVSQTSWEKSYDGIVGTVGVQP